MTWILILPECFTRWFLFFPMSLNLFLMLLWQTCASRSFGVDRGSRYPRAWKIHRKEIWRTQYAIYDKQEVPVGFLVFRESWYQKLAEIQCEGRDRIYLEEKLRAEDKGVIKSQTRKSLMYAMKSLCLVLTSEKNLSFLQKQTSKLWSIFIHTFILGLSSGPNFTPFLIK